MKIAGALTVAMLISVVPSFLPMQFEGEGGGVLSLVRPAWGEETWKQEFEAVCSKTEDSMGMTKDELKALIARCDRLKPLIEVQEETTRKVYLKRLQMCRDLLAFVFEAKNKN